MRKKILWGLALALSLPQIATATLGEKEDSITADQKLLSATHRSSTQDSYTVHYLTAPGATVKEFVTADGVVFAVAWSGSRKPKLSALFGTYYAEFTAANASQPRAQGRRPFKAVESPSLVVQRGGHMRNLFGVAYIKALLPAGTQIEDLQK